MGTAPHAETWEEVPPGVQEQVRFIYGALVNGALEVDRDPQPGELHYGGKCAAGLLRWEFVPGRMRLAMANMLMVQRHEAAKKTTACFQSIMVDVVHPRTQ